MTSWVFLVCVFTLFGACVCDVCTPFTGASETPKVSSDRGFSVDVTAAYTDLDNSDNVVVDYLTVHYDKTNNRVALDRYNLVNGVFHSIYNFKYNEKVVYTESDKTCKVSKIPQPKDDLDLFFLGGADSAGNLPGILSFFHLAGSSGSGSSDIINNVIKKGTHYGVTTDFYSSCQTWPVADGVEAKVNITQEWAESDWVYGKQSPVPISLEVKGQTTDGNNDVNRFFRFANYRDLDDWSVNVRTEYVCDGITEGQSHHEFPQVPDYFSFRVEQHADDEIHDKAVIFDSVNQYVFEWQMQAGSFSSGRGLLWDFVSGVSYELNPDTLKCKVSNITEGFHVGFDILEDGKLKKLTPDQYFVHPENAKYYYIGEKSTRAGMADVWIANTRYQNQDMPMEWYFAQSDLLTWNDNAAEDKTKKYRQPVLRKYKPQDLEDDYVSEYIYNFDITRPNFELFSIAECYPLSKRARVSLTTPVNSEDRASFLVDVNSAKWFTTRSIAKTIDIPFLRITDLEFQHDAPTAVIVTTFTMLDALDEISDIVPWAKSKTLQAAITDIKSAVDQKNLVIMGADNKEKKVDKVVVEMANEPQKPAPPKEAKKEASSPQDSSGDSGYSLGALLGLGFAMLAVSLAFGGFVAWRFMKV